jgi:hypothetical protein
LTGIPEERHYIFYLFNIVFQLRKKRFYSVDAMKCFLLRVVFLMTVCCAAVMAANKDDEITAVAGQIGGDIGEVAGSVGGGALGEAAGDLVNPVVGAVGEKVGEAVGGEIGQTVGTYAGEEAANIAENDLEAGAAAPASGVESLWRWVQCAWLVMCLALAQ